MPNLAAINQKRKREYKINRNISAGTIRAYLKDLMLDVSDTWVLIMQKAQKIILKSLEKVKPTFKERQRKLLRCNDRHQTELNYKRGF